MRFDCGVRPLSFPVMRPGPTVGRALFRHLAGPRQSTFLWHVSATSPTSITAAGHSARMAAAAIRKAHDHTFSPPSEALPRSSFELDCIFP